MRTRKNHPYLDHLIPTGAHDDGVLRIRAEAHARDPLGVALFGDGELAVAERVPQLDAAVPGARHDLPVIGREGDGQDIVGVADEPTRRVARRELPQPKGLVPGRRQRVRPVRRDDAVRHDVRVASQSALRIAVRRLVARQIPDYQRLVPARGQEHVGTIIFMSAHKVGGFLGRGGGRVCTSRGMLPGW